MIAALLISALERSLAAGLAATLPRRDRLFRSRDFASASSASGSPFRFRAPVMGLIAGGGYEAWLLVTLLVLSSMILATLQRVCRAVRLFRLLAHRRLLRTALADVPEHVFEMETFRGIPAALGLPRSPTWRSRAASTPTSTPHASRESMRLPMIIGLRMARRH